VTGGQMARAPSRCGLVTHNQLVKLGFSNVFIYLGGLFEWLMLQDIYGYDEFPTTIKQIDFLKYKPPPRLNISLIEN
jgi:hypothetical protein